MEIIQKGFKKPIMDVTETLECINCGCNFRVSIFDIYDWFYASDGKHGFINCPQCGLKLNFNSHHCLNPDFRSIFEKFDTFYPKHIP